MSIRKYNPLNQPKKERRLTYFYYVLIVVTFSFFIIGVSSSFLFGGTFWIFVFGMLTLLFGYIGWLSNIARRSMKDDTDRGFFDLWLPAHITIHTLLTLVFYYVTSDFIMSYIFSVFFSIAWESTELFLKYNFVPNKFKESTLNIFSDLVMAFIGSGIAWFFI